MSLGQTTVQGAWSAEHVGRLSVANGN